jgi:hypothetical protein
MLTHSQIIISTPHNDGFFAAIGAVPRRMWEITLITFNIDKGAIPAFFVQAG